MDLDDSRRSHHASTLAINCVFRQHGVSRIGWREPLVRRSIIKALTCVTALLFLPLATNFAVDAIPEAFRPFLWVAWPVAILLAIGVASSGLKDDGQSAATFNQEGRPADVIVKLAKDGNLGLKRKARTLSALSATSVNEILKDQPYGQIAELVSHLPRKLGTDVLELQMSEAWRVRGMLAAIPPRRAFALLDRMTAETLRRFLRSCLKADEVWGGAISAEGRLPAAFNRVGVLSHTDLDLLVSKTPIDQMSILVRRYGSMRYRKLRVEFGGLTADVLSKLAPLDSALSVLAAKSKQTFKAFDELGDTDAANVLGAMSRIDAVAAGGILGSIFRGPDGVRRSRSILRAIPIDMAARIVELLPPLLAVALLVDAADRKWSSRFFSDCMNRRSAARILESLDPADAAELLRPAISRAQPYEYDELRDIRIPFVWPGAMVEMMDEEPARRLLRAIPRKDADLVLAGMETHHAERLRPEDEE